MSRLNLIYNIISLMNEGAIHFEDLEEFSDQLKETLSRIEKDAEVILLFLQKRIDEKGCLSREV